MQALHTLSLLHGSLPHSERSHCHVLQDPLVGPVPVPVAQELVDAHQPHVARPVHSSQLAAEAQASVLSQAKENQSQSAHVPVVGPPKEPDWHASVASHQPQPERPVHVSHSVSPAHGSAPVVHTPSTQARPEQQSALVTHVCDPVRQAQCPPVQNIQPQHSEEVAQVAPGSAQQMDVVGLARQLRPEQHVEADVHAVPGSEPPPEQVVPPPVVHVPPAHVPVQALPQLPQFLTSVAVLTHVRLQHDSPVLQESPAQHPCPLAPQAPGSV